MDITQLTSFEVIFFGNTAGYALFDHERNEETFEEFKVEAVHEKLGRQLRLAATCNNNEQVFAKRTASVV